MMTKLAVKIALLALLAIGGASLAHASASPSGAAIVSQVRPLAANMWVTGDTQVHTNGTPGLWTYHWSGGGFTNETFATHFNNGTTDYSWYNWSCSFNCPTGQYTYSHGFATAGVHWTTYMIDKNLNKSPSYPFVTIP